MPKIVRVLNFTYLEIQETTNSIALLGRLFIFSLKNQVISELGKPPESRQVGT
jgi:hypothetical protein